MGNASVYNTFGPGRKTFGSPGSAPFMNSVALGSGGGYTGGGYTGGGGGAGQPINMQTQTPPWMSELMDRYRELFDMNRELADNYDVEDLINKQRAENSISMREAEAQGARSGGLSSAERRNLMMDQGRAMGEIRGAGERSKLEFERGLLQDLTGALSGGTGLASAESSFLNTARSNEIDLYEAMNRYDIERSKLALDASMRDMDFITSLAGLV